MEKDNTSEIPNTLIEQKGFISQRLTKDGVINESLDSDHLGIEIISIQPGDLYVAVSFLKKPL